MAIKFFIKPIYALFLLSLLGSCNIDNAIKVICGDLSQDEREKLRIINMKYKSFGEVKSVPCEYIHVNLFLKVDKVDTVKISSIHDLIYDEDSKIGWQSVDVYNKKGEYIFSHHHNGKINVKIY